VVHVGGVQRVEDTQEVDAGTDDLSWLCLCLALIPHCDEAFL